jgi:hypothetical protein
MTQVRPIGGGEGLFAKKAFAVGEIILREASPLVQLSPKDDNDELKLFAALGAMKSGETTFLATIKPPSLVDPDYKRIFRAMIQAILCFTELDMNLNESKKVKLFQLYSPDLSNPSPEEAPIVKVSKQALEYIQKNAGRDSKTFHFVTSNPEKAQQIMLIWSCNSFEGGRIYDEHSRVNHSCSPNAVIQTESEEQFIKAASPLAEGDEISISYLGLMLYSDRATRQQQLSLQKHFRCQCKRCISPEDIPAAIPCTHCHTRQGRYLEEDVAYDDEETVHYMVPGQDHYHCEHCKTTIEKDNESFAATLSVSQKVAAHLRESASEEDEEAEEFLEQLHQLAQMVTGARHWTTNLVSLLRLDARLQHQHAALMEGAELPDLADIAETVDALQRLWKYFEGLDLDIHPGHVLSAVVVGVARLLVSLGDEKSRTYCAWWVEKIRDYSDAFDNPGMKKVVEALLQAPCQDSNREIDKSNNVTKKQKTK